MKLGAFRFTLECGLGRVCIVVGILCSQSDDVSQRCICPSAYEL